MTIERTTLSYPDEPGRRIGIRVERSRATPEREAPVAVLLHGFKGFMDWGFFPYLSERFAAAGFVAVSMNASGCGIGDDPLVMDDEEAFFRDTYSRQLEDIDRAREFARGLPWVDPGREVLFGHSRGGGMAVISAAERPPFRLVTWAAIADGDRTEDDAKRLWREEGEIRIPNARTGQIHRISTDMLDDFERNRKRLDIRSAAARLACPFLAVHGADDTTVDPSAARELAAAAPDGHTVVLPDTNHGMNATHPLHRSALPPVLLDALERTLSFARSGTKA